jgi:hypothetical protein
MIKVHAQWVPWVVLYTLMVVSFVNHFQLEKQDKSLYFDINLLKLYLFGYKRIIDFI